MKTTIDISDPLLDEARAAAARQGVTLKALVEQGLRRVIDEASTRPAFRLRDASVDGEGLQPEAKAAGWPKLLSLAYEGRGG